MLCNTCQRQQTCLLTQLATSDKQVQAMLHSLKKCELKQLESNPHLPYSLSKITQRVSDFSRWLKKSGDRGLAFTESTEVN